MWNFNERMEEWASVLRFRAEKRNTARSFSGTIYEPNRVPEQGTTARSFMEKKLQVSRPFFKRRNITAAYN